MTHDEFASASSEAAKCYGEVWWDRFARILFEEDGWMTGDEWRSVCRRVITTTERPPYPHRFHEVILLLGIRRPAAAEVCERCKGKRGFYVYLKHKIDKNQNGEPIYKSAFRRCNQCVGGEVKGPPSTTWGNWEEVSEVEFYDRGSEKVDSKPGSGEGQQ